ncbi:MAG: YciI family protein [Gammaproteobacteria bacterium]|nr:YciI family protein [Gammaproteobacteria bacterium]
MAKFMLLLHETPMDFDGISPEEIQKIIGEYSAWSENLAAKNQLVGGHKLKDEGGRHLSQADGKLRIVDGPYSEAKEVLGGFFIIEAADYNEAVKISEDCPHLKFGGRIELREVDPIDE